MASNTPQWTQDFQARDLDVEKDLQSTCALESESKSTTDVLDLSCRKQRKSPSVNVDYQVNTYSSLPHISTAHQCEQLNNSNAERHSPYNTMSPYSESTSPMRNNLNQSYPDTNSLQKRHLNEQIAAFNRHDHFISNYSSAVSISSRLTPLGFPSQLLSSNENLSNVPKEFPTGSSIPPIPFVQQSLPMNNTLGVIPQSFAPINILQSTDAVPATQSEMLKKSIRPFKAYPKDSSYVGKEYSEKYAKFRDQLMQTVKKVNEAPNSRMRRRNKSPSTPNGIVEDKDAAYWERRKKNNAAAKRSRDARRAKEDELAITAAFFQHEYQKLRDTLQCFQTACVICNIDFELLLNIAKNQTKRSIS